MLRRVIILAVAAGAAASMAQQEPKPSLALFAQTRVNTSQNLRSQPNYVCLETIERSQKSASKKRATLLDVLRFEVAFVEHQELYAWPGSHNFDEKNLWEMVPPGGSIGTGSFAIHAYNLFVATGPRFLEAEWTELNGKQVAKFPYDVTEMVSGYRIRANTGQWIPVAYHGSVFINPASAQVLRIEVIADQIPIQLEIAESHTVVDYGDIKIGDRDYRLPTGAVDILTRFTGLEQRNDSRFSGCRAYQTESKLSFGDPPPADEAQPQKQLTEVELPHNADFFLELVTRIDSEASQTGDALEARLTTPVKLNHEVLFDKKSVVEGRILRLQRLGQSVEAVIEFTTISDGSKRARFTASPVTQSLTAPMASLGKPTLSPIKNRAGSASIFVQGSKLVLTKGTRSEWVTDAK